MGNWVNGTPDYVLFTNRISFFFFRSSLRLYYVQVDKGKSPKVNAQNQTPAKHSERLKSKQSSNEIVRNGSAKSKTPIKSPMAITRLIPKPILRSSTIAANEPHATDTDISSYDILSDSAIQKETNGNAGNALANCVSGGGGGDLNGSISLQRLQDVNDYNPRHVPARTSPNAAFSTPMTPMSMSMTASSSFSWTRERALEQQIENLRETLKDTEERLQSLRLQYDNVSQMHRTLRDTNNHMHEEMDRLKIDAQHLRECANILRTELQAARKDRADAIEVQKVLQRELVDCRTEKRKACEEAEANGKQILDLQRQCKEMERIMSRKNPDAMASLLGKIDFIGFLSFF